MFRLDIEDKEWLFSGIGVTVITAMVVAIRLCYRKSEADNNRAR